METKKAVNYRLDPTVEGLIRKYAGEFNCSQAKIIEEAIWEMFARIENIKKPDRLTRNQPS